MRAQRPPWVAQLPARSHGSRAGISCKSRDGWLTDCHGNKVTCQVAVTVSSCRISRGRQSVSGLLWGGLRQAAGTACSPGREHLHCPASGPVQSDSAVEACGSLNSLCFQKVDQRFTCGRERELSLRSWGSPRDALERQWEAWRRVWGGGRGRGESGRCMATILPGSETLPISPPLALPSCLSGN